MIGLATPHATGPAARLQVVEGSLQGFNLADPVIGLQVFHATGLPKPPVQGLHSSRGHLALTHHQTNPELLGELSGVGVGLWRQITGIDPDHRHSITAGEGAQHVQKHSRLDAKTRGESKSLTELLQPPGQTLLRLH